MAAFNTSHYSKALTFFILFLKTLAFHPIPLFSIADFEKDLRFKSSVALYGNAELLSGGSGIHFSGSGGSSAGRVMYKRPIKLVEGKPRQLVSFSTYFAFSIPLEKKGGLAFVVFPKGSEGHVSNQSLSGFPFGLNSTKLEAIGVKFSASEDGGNGVSSSCNVAIYVGNSVLAKKSCNSSNINLGLKNGDKLRAWIDYEASSRRLEVRLSKHGGNSRPSDPLLWHSIDITNVLKEEEVLVGLSSVKENASSQACFLYSWSFVLRHFPHSVHSEPLDPKVYVKNIESPMVRPGRRSDCFLRILAGIIFGTGCGALAAFVVLYFWTIFGNRRVLVVPEDSVLQPVDVEYRKIKVVVDETIQDGKK